MQSKQIDIEWLSDIHECDDCGMSDADGAVIKIDGKEVLELLPSAYCYDSDSWDKSEVMGLLLGQMGVRVMLQNEDCEPRDLSRGRPCDEFADLPPDTRTVLLETFVLRDDDTDDYSQGFRITREGEVLIEKLPSLMGPDKSPYYTTKEMLVEVAEFFGARFSPDSISG